MADDQGSRSSSAPRPSGGGMAGSVGSQTIRGAVLVLVAVAVGVLLLNVVDDGTVASTTKTTAAANGTTKTTNKTTSTTAAPAPAGEVKIQVLNGGGPVGAAGAMSEKLRTAGYTDQGTPADAATAGRTGNYVFCIEGMKPELTALKKAVKTAEPAKEVVDAIGLPAGEPASSAGYECLVFVGA